jgi:hypothetical protein
MSIKAKESYETIENAHKTVGNGERSETVILYKINGPKRSQNHGYGTVTL